MARINSLGVDDMIRSMEREYGAIPGAIDAMLEAGADVLVDEVRNQISEFDIFDKGATFWSISKRNVKNTADGRMIEVWPAGTRRDENHPKGERVETVAFIAEYGTSKKPARPFMSTAAKVAAPAVEAAMIDILEERMKNL